MEPAIGFARDTLCCIFTTLYRQIHHLTRLGQDVGEMQRLFHSLNATMIDINNRLEMQGREAFEVVKKWMDEVRDIEEDVVRLNGDYNLHKRCLFGCCPHCAFMLTLSTALRDCIQNLRRLSDEGKFESLNGQFGEVPRATELVPVARLVGQTPHKAQAVIEGWLADEKTSIIGIHGTGGVGKTSLVQNINNNPNLNTWFDVVIFVAVPQNADIGILQNSIAGRLGLNLPESGEERRRRLFNYLQRKRYLLILDDLWEEIDLDASGVGQPSVGGGCKIVLTSRHRGICLDMGATEILELKILSPEEGWELFGQKAFLGEGEIPEPIEGIAKQFAAHCGGLPLAINCVAKAMRGQTDPQQWRSALNKLESVDDTFQKGLLYLKSLKLSYDSLPAHLKLCFLHCALYQREVRFYSFTSKHSSFYIVDKVTDQNELIEMWIAEGLLVGGGRDNLYSRGYEFINAMRDSRLVQTIDSPFNERWRRIKVHDVLQDLATHIGKIEKTCVYRGGPHVVDLTFEEEEIVECRRISLADTNIVSFPTGFTCPALSSLVCAGNRRLKRIPEDFFTNLPSLKVLDLSATKIDSLPSSLGLLKQLVYLNLFATPIQELPESIGEITGLQYLDLHCCYKLTTLSVRISELKSLRTLNLLKCETLSFLCHEISLLTSLERLFLYDTDIYVGEESSETERNGICLSDLIHLKCLRELQLQIQSPIGKKLTEGWINMTHLELKCSHTNREDLPEGMQGMNRLEIFSIENCNVVRLPNWMGKFQYLSYLEFKECQQLTEIPEVRSLPSLRTLSIRRCNLLKGLEVGVWREGGYPMLQHLYVKALPSLETLVGPRLERGVMPNLKQLIVRNCDELKTLPLGMEKLPKLEEIRGTQHWWSSLTWKSDDVRRHLQKFYIEWAS